MTILYAVGPLLRTGYYTVQSLYNYSLKSSCKDYTSDTYLTSHFVIL